MCFYFLLTLHRTSHLCVDIYFLLWNTDSSSCLTPVRLLGRLEHQLYLTFDHLEGLTSGFAQVRHWRGLPCVVKTSSPSSGRTKKLHATFAFFKLFYQKKTDSSILQLASTLFSVEECTVLLLREIWSSLIEFFDQNPLPNSSGWWKMLQTYQFSSVAQSCPTLCDTMNCSMPGLPVHHQLLEFT